MLFSANSNKTLRVLWYFGSLAIDIAVSLLQVPTAYSFANYFNMVAESDALQIEVVNVGYFCKGAVFLFCKRLFGLICFHSAIEAQDANHSYTSSACASMTECVYSYMYVYVGDNMSYIGYKPRRSVD